MGLLSFIQKGKVMSPKIGDYVKVRVYADIARITLVGRVVSIFDEVWTGNPGIEVEFYNATQQQYVIATIDANSLEHTAEGWKSK